MIEQASTLRKAIHNTAVMNARTALTETRRGSMEKSNDLTLFTTSSGSGYLVDLRGSLVTGGTLGTDVAEFDKIRLSPDQKDPYANWSCDVRSSDADIAEKKGMHLCVLLNSVDGQLPFKATGNTLSSFATGVVVDVQKGLTWQQYLDMSAGPHAKYKTDDPAKESESEMEPEL